MKHYWGYDAFRPGQLDVMEGVCRGEDTLALMPTGAGKSLLYQLPAMVIDGTCIVVTPLISLMKDQVDRLRRMGIAAVAIHSGMTLRQIDLALENCLYGKVKFLYVAPERLEGDTFRLRAARMKLSLVAVDEAHCISQWGYDFRPAYLKIAILRRMHPEVPVLALTASATPDVARDIMLHLQMDAGRVVRTTFIRRNLSYSVRGVEDKPMQLLRIINNVSGSGIVYVRTRKKTEQIAQLLEANGISADHYHAGLGYAERTIRQERWMNGTARVMVATSAFGMGIDKADVRFVVHFDIPDSPEEYYQEAGRAGRDGRRSYAVLLASPDERMLARQRFSTEFPPLDKILECYEAIFNYLQIGIGEGKNASMSFNLFEFAARQKIYSSVALNAVKILQMGGYMHLTEELDNPTRIIFTVNRDDLYKIRVEREDLDHFLRTILRLYDGVFTRLTAVDEKEIAYISGYTLQRVQELFKRLWQLRIIKYIPGNRSPLLILTEERLPAKDVYISPTIYETRKKVAAERVEAMFRYAEKGEGCRSVALAAYFGEDGSEECGICDLCIDRKRREGTVAPTPEEVLGKSIINILRREPLTVKELVMYLNIPPEDVVRRIDAMLSSGEISLDESGRLQTHSVL